MHHVPWMRQCGHTLCSLWQTLFKCSKKKVVLHAAGSELGSWVEPELLKSGSETVHLLPSQIRSTFFLVTAPVSACFLIKCSRWSAHGKVGVRMQVYACIQNCTSLLDPVVVAPATAVPELQQCYLVWILVAE